MPLGWPRPAPTSSPAPETRQSDVRDQLLKGPNRQHNGKISHNIKN